MSFDFYAVVDGLYDAVWVYDEGCADYAHVLFTVVFFHLPHSVLLHHCGLFITEECDV